MTSYKTCAVPMCKSTTVKCPNKLFIHVPNCLKRRKKWLQLARRDPRFTSDKSAIFFCEDHFDLRNDMENYTQYNIMGYVGKIRMRPDCLPSRFQCQPDRIKRTAPPQPRSAANKRRHMEEIKKIFSKETDKPLISDNSNSKYHSATRKDDCYNFQGQVMTDKSEQIRCPDTTDKLIQTPTQTTSTGVKGEQDVTTPGFQYELLTENQVQDDMDLKSADDLSGDESPATVVSWSQQVRVESNSADSAGEELHDTLRCDSCRDVVPWIRQVCVECEYTHCMSCEARGAHAHHYMLRVPGPRPEEVVQRIVKTIQMVLAESATVDPYFEPEVIKSEIKTEPEPDPLAEVGPSAEQLRPSNLEEAMLDIIVEEVVDPPHKLLALQATPSTSSDCSTNLPTTNLAQTRGESSSNKRRSSSASQASAAKKIFITVDAGSIGDVTVKTEPLTAEESLQNYQEASGSGESGDTLSACVQTPEESLQTDQEPSCSGESSMTSNRTKTRIKRPPPAGCDIDHFIRKPLFINNLDIITPDPLTSLNTFLRKNARQS